MERMATHAHDARLLDTCCGGTAAADAHDACWFRFVPECAKLMIRMLADLASEHHEHQLRHIPTRNETSKHHEHQLPRVLS